MAHSDPDDVRGADKRAHAIGGAAAHHYIETAAIDLLFASGWIHPGNTDGHGGFADTPLSGDDK